MKLVSKKQGDTQLREFTFWEHIFSLIPLNDTELRKEVADISQITSGYTFTPLVPDGEFEVTNRKGKKVTVDGDDLISGASDRKAMIPVGTPEYQKFFQRKLKLLDKIQKKYHGEGHETLEQEIGILRCKNQNLMDGIGYENSPGTSIIHTDFGLQKFQDVLYDIETEQKNKSDDMMKWSLKDPAVVEQSMKEFGLTDIQRKFKEINEHNAEWAKEWYHGKRNPEKLREIGEKLKNDVKELDVYIPAFEKKYRADMALPEEQRKIYNITNRRDISINDLIIDKDADIEDRGINGRNWENRKIEFAEELERQLITAELQEIATNTKLSPDLKTKVKSYIAVTNANLDAEAKGTYEGNALSSESITGIRRLMDLKAAAEKNPQAAGAKEILALADKHLNDPANAAMVEKANKINQEHAEMLKKVTSLNNAADEAGIKNGDRLTAIYKQKDLGGSGELRYYRSTIATMQYFNKESDEVVLSDMRAARDNPENCTPEEKQKMARAIEKFFKSVMEFDNEKCEYNSYQELWSDPKHKDLHIMGSIAMESEQLVKQYKKLMKDPDAKCALDQDLFHEVESKLTLLELEAPVAGTTGVLAEVYNEPSMADYSMQQLVRADPDVLTDLQSKTKEIGLIHVAGIRNFTNQTIQPKEKYIKAINRERNKLGLKPFADEDDITDRYYDVIQAIDNAAARDLEKAEELKAAEKKEEPVKEEKPTELQQEEPKKEEVKQEEPQKEEIKQEEPQKEEIKQEEPQKEEIKKEEPQKEAPKEPEIAEPEIKPRKRRNTIDLHHETEAVPDLADEYFTQKIAGQKHKYNRAREALQKHQEKQSAQNGWQDGDAEIESLEADAAYAQYEKRYRARHAGPYIKRKEIQQGTQRGDFLDYLTEAEKGLNARHRFDVGRVFSGDSKDMQQLKQSIAAYKEYVKNPFAEKFALVTEMDLLDDILDSADNYKYAKTHDPKTGKKKQPDSKMGRARLDAADSIWEYAQNRKFKVMDLKAQYEEEFENDPVEGAPQHSAYEGFGAFLYGDDDDDYKPHNDYLNLRKNGAENEGPTLGTELEDDINALVHGYPGEFSRKYALKQVIVRKALVDEYGKDAVPDDEIFAKKYKEFAENGVLDKVDQLSNEAISDFRHDPMQFYQSLGLNFTRKKTTPQKELPKPNKTVDEIGDRPVLRERTAGELKRAEKKLEEKKSRFEEKAVVAFLHEFYQEAKKEIMDNVNLSDEEKKQRIRQNPRKKYIEDNKQAYMKDENFRNFMDSIKNEDTLNALQAKSGKELFEYYKSGVYLNQPEKQQEPVKQEPVKQEHVKQEHVKQEPVKQEPVKQEPVKQQDAPAAKFGEAGYLSTFLANAQKNGWNAPEDKEFLTQVYNRAQNANQAADRKDMADLAHKIESKPLAPETAAASKSRFAHRAYNTLQMDEDKAFTNSARIEAGNVFAQAAASYQHAAKKQKAAEAFNVNEVRAEAQAKLNASFEEKKQYPDKNAAVQEYAVITASVPVQSMQSKGALTGLSKDDFDVQVNALKKTKPFKTMIDGGSDKTLFEKATRDKGQDLYAELGRSRTLSQKQQQQKQQQQKEKEKVRNMDDPKKGGMKI